LVHAYPGARGLPDLVREAEVVGVEVRDQDRRHLADLVPGFPDPRHQPVPRLVARPPGVYQHRPPRAFQEVGEHVPPRAVRERRGHGPDTGPYLLDRREHPVAPGLSLHRPGDGDRLSLTRHLDFNGHLNLLPDASLGNVIRLYSLSVSRRDISPVSPHTQHHRRSGVLGADTRVHETGRRFLAGPRPPLPRAYEAGLK